MGPIVLLFLLKHEILLFATWVQASRVQQTQIRDEQRELHRSKLRRVKGIYGNPKS